MIQHGFIYQNMEVPGQFNPGDKEIDNTSIKFVLFFKISWRRATWIQDATQSKTLSRDTEASSILSSPVGKESHRKTSAA